MAFQFSILLAILLGFQLTAIADAASSSGTAPQYSNGSISTTIRQTQVSYKTKVVSSVRTTPSTNSANGMLSSGIAPQTINGSILTTRGPTLASQTLIRYQKTRIGPCAPCMILASEDGQGLLSKVLWHETPVSVTVDTVTAHVTKYNHTTITSYATNHGNLQNSNLTIEAELRQKLFEIEGGELNIKNYYKSMGNFVRANGTDGDVGNGVTSIAYPTPYVGIRGFILITSLANNTEESCQMTSAFSAANPERQGRAPEIEGLGSTTIMLDNTYYSPLQTMGTKYTDIGRMLFGFGQHIVMSTEPWKVWLESNTALANQYPMLSDCLHAEFAFGPPAFKLPVTAMTTTTTKTTSATGAPPAPGDLRQPQIAPQTMPEGSKMTPAPSPETPEMDKPAQQPPQPGNSRQKIEPPSANPPVAGPPHNNLPAPQPQNGDAPNNPAPQPQNGGISNNPVPNSPEPQNQGSSNQNPPSLPGQDIPNQGSPAGTNNQNPPSLPGQGTPNQGSPAGTNNQSPPSLPGQNTPNQGSAPSLNNQGSSNPGSSPGSQNQNFPNLGLTPGTNDQNPPSSPGQGTPNQNPSPGTNGQGSSSVGDLLESLDQGSSNVGSSPGSANQGSPNVGASPGSPNQGSPNVGSSPGSQNPCSPNVGSSPGSQNPGSQNVGSSPGTQNQGSPNGPGAVIPSPPTYQTFPAAEPVWTVASTAYTPVPAADSGYVIAGQTLSPGGSITVDNAFVSYPSAGGGVVVAEGGNGGAGSGSGTGSAAGTGSGNGVNAGNVGNGGNANGDAVYDIPPATFPINQPVWTLGGTPYTPVPTAGSAFVIADQTLSPGGSITVDGAVVSLPTSGNSVIVAGPQGANGVGVQQGGNGAAIATIPTTQSVWTLGGTPYTPIPTGSGFVIADQTLSPGSSITVDGAVVSLPTSGGSVIVQGPQGGNVGNAAPIATIPTNQPVWTLGGIPYTPTPTGSAFVIADQTLRPGQSVTVDGAVLSLPTSGGSVIVQAPQGANPGNAAAPIATIPTNQPVWTLGGTPYTPIATGSAFIIAGQTLSPGSSITVNNAILSLPTSGGSVIVRSAAGADNLVPQTTLPVTQSVWTLNGTPYTPTPTSGSAYIIAGQTLSPGQSVTVNGEVLSYPSTGGGIVVGTRAGTATGTGRGVPSGSANATASSTDGLGNVIMDGFGGPSTSSPSSTPTTGAENSGFSLRGSMQGGVVRGAAACGFVWAIGGFMI